MSKLKDVVAVTGTYQDKDGNTKNRYANIGVIIQTKNGPMLKLETVPLGWDGFAYLNEPKARDGQQAAPKQASASVDEDIPFMRLGREALF